MSLSWEHLLPFDVVSYSRENFLVSFGPAKPEILLCNTISFQLQSCTLKHASVTSIILCSLKYFGLLCSGIFPASLLLLQMRAAMGGGCRQAWPATACLGREAHTSSRRYVKLWTRKMSVGIPFPMLLNDIYLIKKSQL